MVSLNTFFFNQTTTKVSEKHLSESSSGESRIIWVQVATNQNYHLVDADVGLVARTQS